MARGTSYPLCLCGWVPQGLAGQHQHPPTGLKKKKKRPLCRQQAPTLFYMSQDWLPASLFAGRVTVWLVIRCHQHCVADSSDLQETNRPTC